MINVYSDKTYFSPGDVVQLKQNIPNKPTMIVYRIERSIIKNDDDKNYLRGCRVRWFTTNGQLQEAIFSTKDLIKIEND